MRTDLNLCQLPSTIPSFGTATGKNLLITDPDFGQRMVRLSDSTDYNGATIKTADGASAGLWNKNDTLFIARATGAQTATVVQSGTPGFPATAGIIAMHP